MLWVAPAAGPGGKTTTRDWGNGPRSSLLFALLYRMRLLVIYGIWVTMLYGAVHSIVSLATGASKHVRRMVDTAGTTASHLATAGVGMLDGSNSAANNAAASRIDSSNDQQPATSTQTSTSDTRHKECDSLSSPATNLSTSSSAAPWTEDAAGGDPSLQSASTAAAVNWHAPSTPDIAGKSGKLVFISAAATAASPHNTAKPEQSRLQHPSTRFVHDLLSVVMPVYLLMMGSLVFSAGV